jgi:hypothetical protein
LSEEATTRYRRTDQVVRREIAGEVLLVPVRGELAQLQQMFVLNPVGEFIWSRLDGERGVEALVAELVDAFEVSAEQAHSDIEAFLSRLSEAGLAHEVKGEPGTA